MCTNRILLAMSLSAGWLLISASGALSAPAAADKKASGKAAQPQAMHPEAIHKATPQQRAMVDRLDPLSRATFWSNETDLDPSDTVAGVKLAEVLRELGRYEEADSSAQRVLAVEPNNYDALLETARARIAGRKGFYAIEPLRLAIKAQPGDWRPQSLLGVALEQSERPAEAKEAYQRALSLSPDNPAVLSNLAMSYASEGDRVQAEQLLRRAVARPDATIKERQNLALIVGLQGRIDEAERLIRSDLPPDVASANIAYLRSLQPARP